MNDTFLLTEARVGETWRVGPPGKHGLGVSVKVPFRFKGCGEKSVSALDANQRHRDASEGEALEQENRRE